MSKQELKRGEFNAYYPISDLKMAKINRNIFNKHSENFKNKLNNYGWLMPIVLSSKGDVIEGHHRIISAKLLNQKTIPAYIVDWIDTSKEKEHLDCIIGLNNGNRPWFNLDYLKAFSKNNFHYDLVYKSYLKYNKSLSTGNIINCFFGRSINNKFKKGKCKIINKKLAYYLLEKLSFLVEKHSKSKIQAYSIREIINISHKNYNGDYKLIDYILNVYDDMAYSNHPKLNSSSDFKLHIQNHINIYNDK